MRRIDGAPAHSSSVTSGLSWLGLTVVLVMIALAVASQLGGYRPLGWVPVVLLTVVGVFFGGAYVLVQKLVVLKLDPAAPPSRRLLVRIGAMAVVLVAVLAGAELAASWSVLMDSHLAAARTNFFLVGFSVTVAAAMIDYGNQQLRHRARELELREERLRRQAVHAELSALRARTDPHFLFNSLNTVAGLVEEDPAKASLMLERLAGLFRYALEGSKRESVPLAEEISAVEAYLDVESIRFGDRFRWRVEVGDALCDVPVPPLFLQPVVENAVVHGAGPKRGPALVEVRIRREGSRLRVEVEDDGGGPGSSPVRGSGVALRDLSERLALLYGDAASLSAERGAAGGMLVVIELPAGAS